MSQRLLGSLESYKLILPFSINLFIKKYVTLILYYVIRIFEEIINKINYDHVYLELYNEVKFNRNNKMTYNEENNKVCKL